MALEQTPVVLTGGVNNLMDPLAVPDTDLILGKNLFPRKPGLASVRWAMRHLEYATPDPNLSSLNFNQVRDFFFTNNLAAGIVLAVSGGNWQDQGLHAGTAYDYADEGVRLILMTNIAGAGNFYMQLLGEIPDRPCVFDLNDYIISIDGLNVGHTWRRGTPFMMAPIVWTGEPVANFRPKLAVPVFNARRTVYAQDNFLVWSDSDEPFSVGTSWALPETNPITAIDKVSTSGILQAQTDTLLVRTMTSAYLVSGEPDETSAIDNARPSIAKLPVAAGCVSQATSVNTPYGQIWCGQDDVWLLSGGAIPRRIGSKIRPQIQRLAPGYEWTAHACYADGIYRLALPSAGQEQGPDEPLQEQYWLDLRAGVSQDGAVQWHGPMVHIPQGVWDGEDRQGTTNMKLDTRIGNAPLACSAVGLRSLPAVSAVYDTWPTAIALVAFDGDEPVDSAYPRYASHPEVRAPDTVYALGDVVSWNDFLWICTLEGTTSSGPTSGVFTGAGSGGSWLATGGVTGYTLVDGTVNWKSMMVVPDGIDGSSFPKRSPCPAFMSNARANDSLVLFEILTKEFTGRDPQLDKRLDSADLSYAASLPFSVAYQMLPNFTGYTYPGIERRLAIPDTLFQINGQELPGVADVRRLAKDQLPADPTKRNSAQHYQFRLQNLGKVYNTVSEGEGDVATVNAPTVSIWARDGADYYNFAPHPLLVTAGTRRTMLQIVTEINSLLLSLFSIDMTVSFLTGGVLPSGALVVNYTGQVIDPLNPMFAMTIEVPGASPFDEVWVLFNEYGNVNPDSSSTTAGLSDNALIIRRRWADFLGGAMMLTDVSGEAIIPGETKLIYPPNAMWSCQPVVPEIATFNLFTKTYGRISKTGAARALSTS